jgi:hypothetical protein
MRYAPVPAHLTDAIALRGRAGIEHRRAGKGRKKPTMAKEKFVRNKPTSPWEPSVTSTTQDHEAARCDHQGACGKKTFAKFKS